LKNDIFDNGINIYIDLDIEPFEVYEFIDVICPIIHKVIPNIMFEVDSYRVYEEKYGGFLAYGVLAFDITKLTKDEITFIKKVVFENI